MKFFNIHSLKSTPLKQIPSLLKQYSTQNLQENINAHSHQILTTLKYDPLKLCILTIQLQQLTQDPNQQFVNQIRSHILKGFPSKQLLLQTLHLNCDPNLKELKNLPNNLNDPLIYLVLNQLIKYHDLDYKDSTAVLNFLHNRKLLKPLFQIQTKWVITYIQESLKGLSYRSLKNYALLSRIYSDLSTVYLSQIADNLPLISNQSNQTSLVTLYYTLSQLQRLDILQKISSQIQLNKLSTQDCIQMLLGAMQSKQDESTALRCFNQLRLQKLSENDEITVQLVGIEFKFYSKEEIKTLTEQQSWNNMLNSVSSKQLGELCFNLKQNYNISFDQYFQDKLHTLHPNNITNIYFSLDKPNQEIQNLIKEFIKKKKLDFAAIIKLIKVLDIKNELREMLNICDSNDVSNNLKEIAGILLYLDQYEDIRLIQHAIRYIEQDISSAKGLGNIFYIITKKQHKIELLKVDHINKILNDCDPIELINFLKALLYQCEIRDEELMKQIIEKVKQKVNQQLERSAYLQKHIRKQPQHLRLLLDM